MAKNDKKPKEVEKEIDEPEEAGEDSQDAAEAPAPKKAKVVATPHPIIDNAMKNFEGSTAKDFDLFEIQIPNRLELYINGEKLEGKLIMPRHLYVSIVPMIEARQLQEESVSSGRNYLTRKNADGRLVVTQQSIKE